MQKLQIFVFAFFFFTVAQAQQYVLIDPNIMRTYIGYSQLRFEDVAPSPTRIADCLDMQIDIRVVSAFTEDNDAIRIQDAIFAQFVFGLMRSEPVEYNTYTEGKMAVAMKFGYAFLLCYSTDRMAVGAGIKPQWTTAIIGDSYFNTSTMLQFTAPLQAMVNFRPGFSDEFRIVLTGWSNFNNTKSDMGLRLDLPLATHRRIWLYGYTTTQTSQSMGIAKIGDVVPQPGAFKQVGVGLKVGALY